MNKQDLKFAFAYALNNPKAAVVDILTGAAITAVVILASVGLFTLINEAQK
jgi:hypothetical protein